MKKRALTFVLCLVFTITSLAGCAGNKQPANTSAVPANTTASATETTSVSTNLIDKMDAWQGSEYEDPANQEKLATLMNRVKTNLENKGIVVVSGKSNTGTNGPQVANTTTTTANLNMGLGTTTTEAEENTSFNPEFSLEEWCIKAVENSFNGLDVFTDNEFPEDSRISEKEWTEMYEKALYAEIANRSFNGDKGFAYESLTEENSGITGGELSSKYAFYSAYGAFLDIKQLPDAIDETEAITEYRDALLSSPSAWINPRGLIQSMSYGKTETEIKKNIQLSKTVDYSYELFLTYQSADYWERIPTEVNFKYKSGDTSMGRTTITYDPEKYLKYTPFTVKNDYFCFPVIESVHGDLLFDETIPEEERAVASAAVEAGNPLEKETVWSFNRSIESFMRPDAIAAGNDKKKVNEDDDSIAITDSVAYNMPWYNVALTTAPAYRLTQFKIKSETSDFDFTGLAYTSYMRQGILDYSDIRPSLANMQKLSNWAISYGTTANDLIKSVSDKVTEWGMPSEKAGIEGIYLANTYAYTPLTENLRRTYGLEDYEGDSIYTITKDNSAEATSINRLVNSMWGEASKKGTSDYPRLKQFLTENADAFNSWYTNFYYNADAARLTDLAVAYQNGETTGGITTDSSDTSGTDTTTPPASSDGGFSLGGSSYTSDTEDTTSSAVSIETKSDYADIIAELALEDNGIYDIAEQEQIAKAYSDIKRQLENSSVVLDAEAVQFAVENLEGSKAFEGEVFEQFVRELRSLFCLKSGYIYLSDSAIYDSVNQAVIFEGIKEYQRPNGKEIWSDFCKLAGITEDSASYEDLKSTFSNSQLTNVCDYAVNFSNGGVISTISRGTVVDGFDWTLQIPIISNVITEAQLEAIVMDYIALVGALTNESYSRSLDIALKGLINSTSTAGYTFAIDYFGDFAIVTIAKG